MRAFPRLSTLALAGLALLPAGAAAQSFQRLSVQLSGATLFATADDPTYKSSTRLGFEGQLRYTFGRFSVGAGYQRSTVFSFENSPLTLALSLGFIEPRMVLAAGGGVAGYVAGRLGVGTLVCSRSADCRSSSTNVTYGGGGGLLFRLSRRTSADLGAQYFSVSGNLSSSYLMLRAGLGVGL